MTRMLTVAALMMATTQTAQAGLFKDHWLPESRSCSLDSEATQRAINHDLRECRDAAIETDVNGYERVNTTALENCMTSEGWDRVSKAQAVLQDQVCTLARALRDTPEEGDTRLTRVDPPR